MTKYGWYSQQMRDRINNGNQFRKQSDKAPPAFVFKTESGNQITVTIVSEFDNITGLRSGGLFVDYTDLICLGEVIELVKRLEQ